MSLEILKKYKIKAKKALGQNFLVNDDIVEEIAGTIEVEGKNIIEVGPWYGALTEKLVQERPASLNLVELDSDMIEVLESRIENKDFDLDSIEFQIHKKDILKYEPDTSKYSVIANIPYYITSPILRHFLYDTAEKPESMVILMQMDVGDKILGGKDGKKSSVISLLVEKKAEPFQVLFVGKENFVPAPKVESTVLLFQSHDLYQEVDDERFLKIIKIWFAAVRKKLMRNFVNVWYDKEYILELFSELGFHPDVRAEDLNIKKWCRLVQNIKLLEPKK